MKYVIGSLIVPLFVVSTTSIALADDEDGDESAPQECVRTMILRTPEIIDDDTIVFHATRKRHYLNRLPSTCRGLERQGRITYTKDSTLCANDWFNLLERSGTGLALGISCRLGEFELISEQQLEAIRDPAPPPLDPEPVEPPEIEDVTENVTEE